MHHPRKSAIKKGIDRMNIKRSLTLKTAAALVFLSLMFSPSAAFRCNAMSAASQREITVMTGSGRLIPKTLLVGDTTYVSLKSFCHSFGMTDVRWNQSSRTAVVLGDSLIITAKEGKNYLTANGRVLYCEGGIFISDGVMYVPLRVVSKAIGADVLWDDASFSAIVVNAKGTIHPGASFYDTESVYWLSRIISAEACGEPLLGKIAVGNVVLNRVASPSYPDNIFGVIFDMRCGPQFTPAATGAVYRAPTEESVIAAKICLEGYSLSKEIEFFMNPRTADTEWMTNNCTFVFRIANHDFYS